MRARGGVGRHHRQLAAGTGISPTVEVVRAGQGSAEVWTWRSIMFTIVYPDLYRPSLMIIASRTQFHVERPWGQRPFSIVS